MEVKELTEEHFLSIEKNVGLTFDDAYREKLYAYVNHILKENNKIYAINVANVDPESVNDILRGIMND